jgi:NADPH-dependent ferric siderophore reductase
LKGYDVDCELFEDFPAEDTFLQEQSVLVELDDDGQRREIPYRKRWRLRDVDHDDEVDFDSLKVGKAISAYWSPNRAYYGAIVIGVRDAPAEPSTKSVKRFLMHVGRKSMDMCNN